MYFWNKIANKDLGAIIGNIKNVKSAFISVAFCSQNGARILKEIAQKNNLSKDNVTIILRKDFNEIGNLSETLQMLLDVGHVYIKKEDAFHPKVYIFTHKNGKHTLIFGSANLTFGGLKKNIEFCQIQEDVDFSELEGFKHVSEFKTFEVTQSIIDNIKKSEDSIKEIDINLNNAQKSKANILNEIYGVCEKDPVSEDSLHFNNHLFVFEDYELFFPKHATTQDDYVINKRKELQGKLLNILPGIEEHIKDKGYDLHQHWDERHITSSIRPIIFNSHYVGWLGVRLGKAKKEIVNINEGLEREEANQYSFQKHSCFQYSLFSDGFWIGIFHSVRNDAIDRKYLHEIIKSKSFQANIIDELIKLKGSGYIWVIGEKEFEIDKHPPSDFIDFYNKYDLDGVESMLGKKYKWDDLKINKANIVITINNTIDDLYSIYSLITKRYK